MQLVESCWFEIDAGENKKTIIIGCTVFIDIPLGGFRTQLTDIIKTIYLNKYGIFILGDLKFDFFKI